MAEKLMTMVAMEAAPEMQAGNYGASIWFQMLLNFLERQFPGVRVFLEAAAAVLPWSKVWQAIQLALAEWQHGKDFLTILQDVLKQWAEIVIEPSGPIRMTAKP